MSQVVPMQNEPYRLPRQFHPKGTLLYGHGSPTRHSQGFNKSIKHRGFPYRVRRIETRLTQTDQKTKGVSKANYSIRQHAYIWLFLSGNPTNNNENEDYLTTNAVQRSSWILHSGLVKHYTSTTTEEFSQGLEGCVVSSLLASSLSLLRLNVCLCLYSRAEWWFIYLKAWETAQSL